MNNNFTYQEKFLSQDEANSMFAFCEAQNIREYPYRGKTLKRSPKVEFGKDDTVGTYRFGQQKEAYSWVNTPFPHEVATLVDKLDDPTINHVIIIRYKHGKIHHIPWHSDKQDGVPGSGAKDIAAGSSIYNVIVCNRPRRFQLARVEDIPKTADGHGEPVVYQFNEAMPHGSMIKITADGNKEMKHRVPKENGWQGTRYSIVCRHIASVKQNQV